ncbi:MAG: hypothetical protein WAN93_01245 [Solirubrobacteraceae bacterium]
MSVYDLPWIAGFALLLIACVSVACALRRAPDWQDRLKRSHATVYERLWELAFWLLRHLRDTLSSAGQRRRHLTRALLAAGLLGALALTPVLALLEMAKPDFVRHGLAIGIGGLIWTTVVESPGMAERIRKFESEIDFIPSVVFALIVLIADIALCCLALGGVIQGQPASSVCVGASFVAAADIVSMMIGVMAAAFPRYPFLDPS